MLICIPALERHNYRDLTVLLTSLKMYAYGQQVRVFHKGRSPVVAGLIPPPYTTYIPQRLDNQHYGDACRQILEETGEEDLLIINDDTVFTPDTLPTLCADLDLLRQNNIQVGLLGLRSNFSAGLQNIRSQHGNLEGMQWSGEKMITEVETVFGVAYHLPRAAIKTAPLDWTRIQWFGDNLLSWDLRQKGFHNFVSRSYIHHHGSQSGKDYEKYDQEGREWLKANRPDFPLP